MQTIINIRYKKVLFGESIIFYNYPVSCIQRFLAVKKKKGTNKN